MNKSIVALWFTLTIAILALSTFAMLWWNQRQQTSTQRLEEALISKLKPYKNQVASVVDAYRLDFQRQLAEVDASNNFNYGLGNQDQRNEPTSWMPFQRDPRIQQIIVLDQNNRLIYPSSLSSMSEAEQGFVRESMAVMKQGAFRPAKKDADQPSVTPATNSVAMSQPPMPAQQRLRQSAASFENNDSTNPAVMKIDSNRNDRGFGWTAWYYGQLMVLGFWSQYSDGTLVMLAVPRTRILSDLIAGLPDNGNLDSDAQGYLFQIIDSDKKVLHQWGNTEMDSRKESSPVATAQLTLERPFDNIQLRIFADQERQNLLVPPESPWPMLAAIASLSGVLLLLGSQVTLAFNRQLKLARQQVSFVNQVSHELRTPLTNISMYAELAQGCMDLESENERDREQLSRLNIIQQETMRLNRLINNVLQFERSDKQLRMHPNTIDTIVNHSLSMFEPRLVEKGIIIEKDLNCPRAVLCDADAIEQIVVNLISNAEKYAGKGRLLGISTRIEGEQLIIRIWDHGPGIPRRLKSKIFKPFVRASHELESPSGTGIGLSIVKQLSKKHGGDCVLEDSEQGACFVCTIRVGRI